MIDDKLLGVDECPEDIAESFDGIVRLLDVSHGTG
jgi:hypothetical protein